MKKVRLKILSILLIGLVTMMTSCVQEDWFELYEDEDLSSWVCRKKNKSDVGVVDYSTGPSVEEIVSDYGVRQRMDQAWASMLESCNCSGRQEFSFFIYYKRERGGTTFVCGEQIPGPFVEWAVGTNASTSDTPIQFPTHLNGATVCARFHVHTSYHYAPTDHHRKTGLSHADSSAVSSFPSIIFDYEPYVIFGGMEESTPVIYSYDPREN